MTTNPVTIEKGIRLMASGKYEATMCLEGDRYTKRFKNVKAARRWRKAFSLDNHAPNNKNIVNLVGKLEKVVKDLKQII